MYLHTFWNKIHNINYCMCCTLWILKCIDNPLTWNGSTLCVVRTSALAGPILRVNCPILGPLPNPHCPSFPTLPANTCKYFNRDDINMPSLVLSGKTIICPAILPGFCNYTSVAKQQYLGYLTIISGSPGNNIRVTNGCLVIIPGLSGNIVRVVWQKNQGWLTIKYQVCLTITPRLPGLPWGPKMYIL